MLCNIICKMDPQSHGCRSEMPWVTFLHHPDFTHDLPDELLKAAVAVHHCDYLSCFRLMRPVVWDCIYSSPHPRVSCMIHLTPSLSAAPTWTQTAGAAGDAHTVLLHLLHDFSRAFVLKLFPPLNHLPQNVMNADRCMKGVSLMVCAGLALSLASPPVLS